MDNTLQAMFTNTFDRDAVLGRAKQVGVVKRLRDIHPADLGLSLVKCAMGDETRLIATARR